VCIDSGINSCPDDLIGVVVLRQIRHLILLLGQAKVNEVDDAQLAFRILAHHDVCWLQVAVDIAILVNRFESL
jgi:hypothetical protein